MDRKIAILIVAAVCVIAALAIAYHTSDDSGSKDFIIIHTGDTHGRIGDDDGTLGFSTAKVLAERYEEQGYAVFTVDLGDFMGGNNLLYVTEGEYAILPMNKVGYDVITIGNHEFDYSVDVMAEQLSRLDSAVICSNLFYPNGEPVLKQYEIIEKKGVRIGFFGLLTQFVNTKTPDIRGDLYVGDPIESAREMVGVLKGKGVDAIVLLSHLGIGDAYVPSSDYVCSVVEGIDICINSHSHTPMEHGKFIESSWPIIPSSTFIADVGCYSKYVGITSCISGVCDGILYKGEKLDDADVDAVVREVHDKAIERGNETVSSTELDLTGYYDVGGGKENDIGKFCLNYAILLADADLAMFSVDTFGAGIAKGDISEFEALAAFPNAGKILTCRITGQELADYIVRNLREGGGPDMLEFSDNVRVYTDDAGREVRSITIDGEELDRSRTYIGTTSIYALKQLFGLSEDRIVENLWSQKELFLGVLIACAPIKEDMLGGDRYVRS